MLLDSPRDEAAHRTRQLRLQGPRLAFAYELGEYAGPGSRHARLRTTALKPREVRRHFRMPGRHDRLEIVASKPRKKGRYFDSFPCMCQRVFEDFPRGNRDLRSQH